MTEENYLSKLDIIRMARKRIDFRKQDIKLVLDTVLDIVAEELTKGNTVRLAELGTFYVTQRSSRVGFNLATKSMMEIDESYIPRLKFNRVIKNKLNENLGSRGKQS